MLRPVYSNHPVKQNYGYSHYKGKGCIHKIPGSLSVKSGLELSGFKCNALSMVTRVPTFHVVFWPPHLPLCTLD